MPKNHANQKHPHADVIHAYADGAQIQVRVLRENGWGKWGDSKYPTFVHTPRIQYRVKPEPKPDIVTFAVIGLNGMTYWCTNPDVLTNVKLTFDGETKKLKAVEFLGQDEE